MILFPKLLDDLTQQLHVDIKCFWGGVGGEKSNLTAAIFLLFSPPFTIPIGIIHTGRSKASEINTSNPHSSQVVQDSLADDIKGC